MHHILGQQEGRPLGLPFCVVRRSRAFCAKAAMRLTSMRGCAIASTGQFRYFRRASVVITGKASVQTKRTPLANGSTIRLAGSPSCRLCLTCRQPSANATLRLFTRAGSVQAINSPPMRLYSCACINLNRLPLPPAACLRAIAAVSSPTSASNRSTTSRRFCPEPA